MTTAYFCIVMTIFIPLFSAAYAKFTGGGYNNQSPREFLGKLEGKAKRAHYAQLNTFEAFAPFAVGVVVAHHMQADQTLLDTLAVSFVIMRILYVFFYIYDLHLMRSAVWFLGLFITIALYFIGGIK